MSDEQSVKIWLVATGEYSDYGVVAVFDDQHKPEAEEFAKLVGGRVEEEPLTLNPTHQEPPAGQSFFQVRMFRNGSLDSSSCDKGIYQEDVLYEDGTLHKCHYHVTSYENYPAYEHDPNRVDKSYWQLSVSLYARDKEHAVKVANEIRIQILAGAKPSEGSIP